MTDVVLRAAERIAAQGDSAPLPGRDPVNQAMINNWVEAIGDTNPSYTDPDAAAGSFHAGLVAPPAMAQVWTMRGLHGVRAGDDPLGAMMAALDDAGYTSVVATNSEQTYHRYLRVGEQVSSSSRLEKVVGPKKTALGEGWFVTTRTTWLVGAEVVAEMVWSVLKFSPSTETGTGTGTVQDTPVPSTGARVIEAPERARARVIDAPESAGARVIGAPESAGARVIDAPEYAAGVLRPVVSRDTEFFWEGTKVGELRIQRWGGVLRHPPGPVDPGGDLAATPDYLVADGRGTVFSFVVHHHPQVPGKRLPFVVALVELTEGVRVLGELIDVDPADVHIGLPVRAVFLRIDDTLTLPAWEVAR